ncbi:hypothetical protein AGR4A_pAt10258 [Agrobacterium tumefaciens str. B6]|uniref:Uncharacterized protein n=1 Tax=Agrobacterium tumefaciens str. B6 TaxID=1183423 RepID=A0A822VBX4_AGRTU|nr:hypothetical protein AGR4A_pAt10258 [Agrobacterium tumefaciens str. B6]
MTNLDEILMKRTAIRVGLARQDVPASSNPGNRTSCRIKLCSCHRQSDGGSVQTDRTTTARS